MRDINWIRVAFIAAALWIVGSFAASIYTPDAADIPPDTASLNYRECMNHISSCSGKEIWHDQYGNATCSAKFNEEEACKARFEKEAAEQRKEQAIKATKKLTNDVLGLVVELLVCFIAWRAASSSAVRRGAVIGATIAWRTARHPSAELKKLSPQMKRDIIIAVLALFWISANAAHAYIFFHGSASNPYVKCITDYEGTKDEHLCGDFYSKYRERFEHDRLGVTLKSTLNATGLALIACFLIIAARRVSAAPKFDREGA